MKMNFIQKEITLENMWTDLEIILDDVDADFTGANGEEYFNDEDISYMASAIKQCENFECEQERIEYVIKKCKEYSEGYYEDFEYSVIYMGNDVWLVTIATVQSGNY